MKKLLAIMLAAACVVSMAACAAKTGGDITLPEASMTDGQLAAPPEVTSVPYPKETDYVKNGTVDYDAYDKAYDDWQAARQEKLQTHGGSSRRGTLVHQQHPGAAAGRGR